MLWVWVWLVVRLEETVLGGGDGEGGTDWWTRRLPLWIRRR